MVDTTVKYFSSAMTGAPTCTGQAGSLIALLDACLVSGFGSVTLNSLVVADNVATATYSSGHGFSTVASLGPVITIAGATPSGLNGEWRITVTSSTQFTFATSGISNQTATGTITAKRSPAWFSKVYSGTNLAAYQSNDITSTQFFWRIDDTTAQYAGASAYETMSDINTGTSFSTSKYVTKSNTSDTTQRTWYLVSDGATVYFFVQDTTTGYYEPHYFGDWIPMVVNSYRCLHAGTTSTSSRANSANPLRYIGDNSSTYNNSISGRITIARSYTGVANGVSGCWMAPNSSNYVGRTISTSESYPSPVTNGLVCAPLYLHQGCPAVGGSILRGVLSGLYAPQHYLAGAYGATLVSGNIDFLRISIGYANADSGAGMVAVDLTGPWR